MTVIHYAGLTDRGRVRKENEDRWFADRAQGLYLVADGMGGMQAGGLASQIVAQTLPSLLGKRMRGVERLDEPLARELLLQTLADLSDRLRDEGRRQLGHGGLGSTVVLLLVRGRHALVAHLGDSRAYRLRDGKLERLTTDHTIVQVLLDCEEIRPEDSPAHPARGQLTRFVGMTGEALPEAQRLELAAADRFLLCSDGLTGMVSDERIGTVLADEPSPVAACRRLIAEANHAGGKDNIVAVVVDVAEESDDRRARASGADRTADSRI